MEVEVQNDRFFLSTELIYKLDRFGEECVPPATDYGDAVDENGYSVSESLISDIRFAGIIGDWRSLPPLVTYRLRELEVMLAESHNIYTKVFALDVPARHRVQFHMPGNEAVAMLKESIKSLIAVS